MAVVLRMTSGNGQGVHPFFMSKATTASLVLKDFNENQEPRKRQRTISPEAGLTALDDQKTNDWADQLKSAAFGQSSTPRAMSDSGSSKDEGIPQYGKTSHKGSPKGQSATNLGPSDSENNVETTQSLKETPTEMLSKTPPKKMLRVRPNGKLDSPKAKATTLDTKPKRGRKPAKLNSKSKTLVATIKYGINEQSRTFLGHKINNVLSGKSIVNIFAKARAVRPTEPSKPTHPFFLGDTKRQQDPLTSNDGKTCGADNQPTTPKRKATSLTNARVTSKPPAASDSTAAMLGFGHNMFGFTQAPVSQFHGAMEPLWPPKEMVHVGRADLPHRPLAATQMFQAPKAHRKLKDVQVYISKEDEVIKPCMNIVHAYHNDIKLSHSVNPRQWRELRRPLRRIMTGRDLQQAIRNNIVSSLPISDMELHEDPDDDELSTSRALQSPAHCAIGHLFREIATSFTAFDKFECEPQDWVHKYAPVCAKHILQQGREVILLRDWLRTLTIKPVGGRNVNKCKIGSASAASKKPAGHCTKRKRKRVEELEGFVISSDEEAQEMDDINDPEDLQPTHALPRKSVIRSTTVENSGNGERITNTVVISGPHGCGKTAAVYAVARELGFEVFEINAGSRRSGKDILDKVGDMTRNHLVKHAKVNEETDFKEDLDGMELLSDQLEQDLDSGRQGTMTSFFKSEGTTKKAEAATKVKAQKNIPNQKKQPQTQQPQKQSLILLEEVDVLFEEDKSFWATTLELILQSKRPIIMTCTDEDLLPLENMVLYAIFRLIPPSVELATDYLLLIACNEGHLLSRDSISDLYKAKGSDLRASMTELNFFCQMAIGDTKGGLDWMLIHSSAEGLDKPKEDGLRVVSDGTYKSGMGCSIGEVGKPQRGGSLEQETAVLSEIWNGWNINIGATGHYVWSSSTPKEFSPSLALNALQNLDQVAEAMSAADTFPACIPLTSYMAALENYPSELTEKSRGNYVEGLTVLEANPIVDYTGVTESLALTISACCGRLLHHRGRDLGVCTDSATIYMISETLQDSRQGKPNRKAGFAAVFDPIARSPKPMLGIPRGPQISSFDGPVSIIAEDLAPYVRSIVSFDRRLEQQRRQLSALLSQPGKGGNRARTTRASRAALEGGSKAHTRRERWFPGKTNFNLVLESGGNDWQEIAMKRAMAEVSEEGTGHCASTKFPLGSAMESDA